MALLLTSPLSMPLSAGALSSGGTVVVVVVVAVAVEVVVVEEETPASAAVSYVVVELPLAAPRLFPPVAEEPLFFSVQLSGICTW